MRKIILLLALIILSAANVAAAAEENQELPFETLVCVYPEDESEVLALIKLKPEGNLAFMVAAKDLEPIGLIRCSRELCDFYFKEDNSPVTFLLGIPEEKREQVDDELGAWEENFHVIPVYALFKVEDGKVICDKPFFSAEGLNPSHYQGKIQNPNHERLIEIFLTYMPYLHDEIDKRNISLP